MVQEISHVNSQNNKYIILNYQASEGKKKLNIQANIKTKNNKKLKVKALVDSGCTHTGIDEKLVKDKRIQTKPINFSFEVFNADRTKNGEITKVASLEIEINRHKETLEVAVSDLNGTDICHIQVYLFGNNVPAVKPPLNHTSPSSTAATFLTTHLMAVLQPSRYSIFHSGDTSIQLGLP